MSILKTKKIFTYVVVGALVIALSISCKNDDKTGNGGGGSVDVPTAIGDAATDLANATYSGTVNRTASEGSAAEFGATTEFTLVIFNNQITAAGMFGALSGKQILKSGSEYSADGEMTEGEVNAKEYIKFTVSADGNSVSLLEYTAGGSANGESFKVTYSGTLNK